MSWSISAGFSTPRSDSLIKTVLGYLAASVRGPCIYNCINRLTLCLISWRTQRCHTQSCRKQPQSNTLQVVYTTEQKEEGAREARRHLDPPPWPLCKWMSGPSPRSLNCSAVDFNISCLLLPACVSAPCRHFPHVTWRVRKLRSKNNHLELEREDWLQQRHKSRRSKTQIQHQKWATQLLQWECYMCYVCDS